MIYLQTSSDGNNHEGIGSVAQWHLILYCFAKKHNLGFSAKPFKNIAHWQYNNVTSEQWSKQFTDFFNFDYIENKNEIDLTHNNLLDLVNNVEDETIINISKSFIVNHGQQYINEYFTNQYLNDIKKKIQYDGEKYFEKNVMNISMHIRSSNPADIPATYANMETFPIWLRQEKIINLIKELQILYDNKDVIFYIHSQGSENQFEKILNAANNKFKIILKLNESPLSDIYHMSNADLLIMAKSSYSWIAHLLNFNRTIVRDNFYQVVYPNSIFINSNYNIKK